MERLEGAVVLVEGKKDQQALEPYVTGRGKAGSKTRQKTCSGLSVREGGVVQISGGRLRSACEEAARRGVRKAIVLTDRDKAGEELAKRAREELEGCGIAADLETRKRLMAILRLAFVENFQKKYEEKRKEIEEN